MRSVASSSRSETRAQASSCERVSGLRRATRDASTARQRVCVSGVERDGAGPLPSPPPRGRSALRCELSHGDAA